MELYSPKPVIFWCCSSLHTSRKSAVLKVPYVSLKHVLFPRSRTEGQLQVTVFFFFLAIAAKCQKSFNLKPEETVIPASSQWNAKLRQVLRMCKCHRDSVLQRSHWHSSDSTAVFCFWFSTNYRQLDIRDLRMQKQTEILHDQLTSPIYKNTAFIYTSLQGQIDGMEREWGAGQGSFWFAWYCLLHAETSEIRLRFSLAGCCMETLLARSESPDVRPLLSESPCIKNRGSNHSNKKRSQQHFQSLFVLFISDNCLSSCMPSGDFAVILLSVFLHVIKAWWPFCWDGRRQPDSAF